MSLCAELTYKCPLRCVYCSNPLHMGEHTSELDTANWIRVLDEAAELGVIHTHFSGGEPLLRDDLPDMIHAARKADLYTDISTSAFTATREKFLELKNAGLDSVQVSLLDSNKEGNDFIAGTPSFEQKCNAIETAKSLGFPVTLNCVLHRHNMDRMTELLDMAIAWGVERIELAHVQYVGWAFENRAALLPTREQLTSAKVIAARYVEKTRGKMFVLHVLPDYYQAKPKACLAGWGNQFITVAPDGAVLPCQTAREIPGLEFPNVTSDSLSSIWHDSEVFNKFRGTDWLPEPCQSCELKEEDFGGCRCQAFLMAGDATVTDPVCHKAPDHHLVQAAIGEAEELSSEFTYRTVRTLN
jgi:pyrroloquinoline quinone biosynthesis protein E